MIYINNYELISYLSRGNIYSKKEISKLIKCDETDIVDGDIEKNKNKEPVIFVCDINYDTIVDGEGFRNSIYCSYCNHKCPQCHNKTTWNLNSGKPIKISDLYNILLEDDNDITFTGGDPFYQAKTFTILAKMIKENTLKTIWAYTGFLYEDILLNKNYLELLKYIDILVDGEFKKELKDSNLPFRGSSNQRIIDVQESLKQDKVILWNG